MSLPPAWERDPYLTELTTKIVAVGQSGDRPSARLADTLFYPEGGGQPADHGRINGIDVVDVQRVDGAALHLLAAPVEVGPARVELDWRRRYDHMQQHTAQHLLSAVAADRFGWATTSFHLGERRCDVEVDAAETEPEQLAELEEAVAGAIRATLPVTARRIPAQEYAALEIRSRGLPESHRGDVRLVEIADVDVTTCGGTHVRSTAEIEALAIGDTEPMRGGTRIYWLAGGRVRRRLAELEARERELRGLFETSGEELAATAAVRLNALRSAERTARRLTAQLAGAHAAALAASDASVVSAHFSAVDSGFLQSVARELIAAAPDKAALLTAETDKGGLFLVAAGAESGVDPSRLGPRVAEILGGRGGGSGATFQGRATSLEARADAEAALSAGPIR